MIRGLLLSSLCLAALAKPAFADTGNLLGVFKNWSAYSTGTDYYGGTQIVDPNGKVMAYLKDEEGLAVHTADFRAAVAKSRTNGFSGLNMIQDRRPEHYGRLTDLSYRHVPALNAAARPSPERHDDHAREIRAGIKLVDTQ